MASERRRGFPVAAHLLLIQGHQVLLSRRYNTGYEDGKWSVPAGHLEDGETITDCVVREAREEVGITLDAAILEPPIVLHRLTPGERRSTIDFFFVARTYSGEVRNAEPEKCDRIGFHPVARLPQNTIPYVTFGIEAALKGTGFAEFGWQVSPTHSLVENALL